MTSTNREGIVPKKDLIALIKADLKGRTADVSTAMLIAASAFHGQDDRNGWPYVLHLQRVLLGGSKSRNKIMVGILHDLIEDTDWTLNDLREVGFPETVVRAVDAVTKKDGEKYFDFIVRCGLSINHGHFGKELYAIDTKLADLEHNMDVSRQTRLMTQKQIDKLPVYIIAKEYLVAVKTGEIQAGMTMTNFLKSRPELYDAALLQEHSSDGRSVGLTMSPNPSASAPAP